MTLTQYLQSQGMTHGAFARLIGVSQAAVTRYATGQRYPKPAIAHRIQAATNGAVTVAELFSATREVVDAQ